MAASRIACDGLLYNVDLLTFDPSTRIQPNACLAWQAGRIVHVGPGTDSKRFDPVIRWDGEGRWVTPGLIDCHTHLVYGGNRADEFERLRGGDTYQQIAAEGGGILGTVQATRQSSEETLLTLAARRLHALMQEGVTTIEIKSGYGLTLADEKKMLRVIAELRDRYPVDVQATCLAAHKCPPEFPDADRYIDTICEEWLPDIAQEQLATAVDVFCEELAFDVSQTDRLLTTAARLGFAVKGHVEQLSHSGGVDVLCRHRALSADHLEFATPDQAAQMKKAGVSAVLLPGAYYYLNETRRPPIEAFRQQQVSMAIATDHNPGSSPVLSLLAAANLASVQFGMTPLECLAGITLHAADALGLLNKGRLEKGADADFVLWDVAHPRDLIYQLGGHRPSSIFWRGRRRPTPPI